MGDFLCSLWAALSVVSGFPSLCKFLVDWLMLGTVHSIVPMVLETSPESETPAG